jgi:hypothetical protein
MELWTGKRHELNLKFVSLLNIKFLVLEKLYASSITNALSARPKQKLLHSTPPRSRLAETHSDDAYNNPSINGTHLRPELQLLVPQLDSCRTFCEETFFGPFPKTTHPPKTNAKYATPGHSALNGRPEELSIKQTPMKQSQKQSR